MVLLALGLIALVRLAAPLSFYVAATLIGAGYCVWYVAINACIGLQSANSKRLGNFSNLSLSFAVSSLLSGLLVGTLDMHGWQPVVLALLLGVFSGAIIHAISLRELSAAPFRLDSCESTAGTATRCKCERSPVLLTLYAAQALTGIAWDTILFGLPFITDSIGGTRLLGACLSVFAAAAVFSRLCITRLVASATVRDRILGCLATTAGGLFAVGASATGSALVLAISLCGLGLGLIKPCISDAICEYSSVASTPSNLSVLSALLAFSAVMVPTSIGWLGELLPIVILYIALGGAALIVAVSVHRWCRAAPVSAQA
jgi:MFS family permease